MRKMGVWREYLIEVLADRNEAIGHLQATLEDYHILGNPAVVRDALQTVIEAQGGVSELAKQADMDPEVFSKMLTHENTPLIDALGTVLKGLGHQLSIQPIETEGANLETYNDALEVQNATTQVVEKQGVRTEQPAEIG